MSSRASPSSRRRARPARARGRRSWSAARGRPAPLRRPPARAGRARISRYSSRVCGSGSAASSRAQRVAQLLVLGERLLAPPVRGEQPHQRPVRRLVQRVLDDRALERLDRVAPARRAPLQRRELDQQRELRLAQLTRGAPAPSPRSGPRAAARRCTARAPRGTPRSCGWRGPRPRGLERLDVDPQPVARQRHDPVAQRQPRLRAAERAARRVEHLMQASSAGSPSGHSSSIELLAVHPPLGRERQQLHQRPRAPQPPRIVGDRPSGD